MLPKFLPEILPLCESLVRVPKKCGVALSGR